MLLSIIKLNEYLTEQWKLLYLYLGHFGFRCTFCPCTLLYICISQLRSTSSEVCKYCVMRQFRVSHDFFNNLIPRCTDGSSYLYVKLSHLFVTHCFLWFLSQIKIVNKYCSSDDQVFWHHPNSTHHTNVSFLTAETDFECWESVE